MSIQVVRAAAILGRGVFEIEVLEGWHGQECSEEGSLSIATIVEGGGLLLRGGGAGRWVAMAAVLRSVSMLMLLLLLVLLLEEEGVLLLGSIQDASGSKSGVDDAAVVFFPFLVREPYIEVAFSFDQCCHMLRLLGFLLVEVQDGSECLFPRHVL